MDKGQKNFETFSLVSFSSRSEVFQYLDEINLEIFKLLPENERSKIFEFILQINIDYLENTKDESKFLISDFNTLWDFYHNLSNNLTYIPKYFYPNNPNNIFELISLNDNYYILEKMIKTYAFHLISEENQNYIIKFFNLRDINSFKLVPKEYRRNIEFLLFYNTIKTIDDLKYIYESSKLR